ncbi:hypothetical protein SAMN05216317_12030 [Nitrosomonas eutropha]|nr:hypothetical protein SAMN05216317_12030 [Nitrosomonas eutropha]
MAWGNPKVSSNMLFDSGRFLACIVAFFLGGIRIFYTLGINNRHTWTCVAASPDTGL